MISALAMYSRYHAFKRILRSTVRDTAKTSNTLSEGGSDIISMLDLGVWVLVSSRYVTWTCGQSCVRE